MNLGFQTKNVNQLSSQLNAWIRIAVLMGVSTLILSVCVFYKTEKVILVPPHITKSFWIRGDEVSKSYLEEMGVYMTKLLLDLSPSNLDHNHRVLLRYATPEAHGKLEKQFFEEAQEYKGLQLTTHFKPVSVTANPQKLEVEVKGTLTSFVASKEVKSTQEILCLKFTHRGNGLLLEKAARVAPANISQESTINNGESHDHF